jgi:hypothetical protein
VREPHKKKCQGEIEQNDVRVRVQSSVQMQEERIKGLVVLLIFSVPLHHTLIKKDETSSGSKQQEHKQQVVPDHLRTRTREILTQGSE